MTGAKKEKGLVTSLKLPALKSIPAQGCDYGFTGRWCMNQTWNAMRSLTTMIGSRLFVNRSKVRRPYVGAALMQN